MKRPMTKFRIDTPKPAEHSFINGFYAHYGKIATFANKKQVERKHAKLQDIGIHCVIDYRHPFTIVALPPVTAEF